MLTRRSFVSGTLMLFASGTLAACRREKASTASSNSKDSSKETETNKKLNISGMKLTVAAAGSPYVAILKEFAVPQIAVLDATLVVNELPDAAACNEAVMTDAADVAFCQQLNQLEPPSDDSNQSIVSAAGIFYSPFGAYSTRVDSLQNLSEEATIAIPNDTEGRGRALQLLQQQGLILLNDPARLDATPDDIAENPKNLRLNEQEPDSLVAALPEVDCAIFAATSTPSVTDALAVETSASAAAYAGVLATKSSKTESPVLTMLIKALKSEEFAVYLETNQGQQILPLP